MHKFSERKIYNKITYNSVIGFKMHIGNKKAMKLTKKKEKAPETHKNQVLHGFQLGDF
jgi:hypothetical protein